MSIHTKTVTPAEIVASLRQVDGPCGLLLEHLDFAHKLAHFCREQLKRELRNGGTALSKRGVYEVGNAADEAAAADAAAYSRPVDLFSPATAAVEYLRKFRINAPSHRPGVAPRRAAPVQRLLPGLGHHPVRPRLPVVLRGTLADVRRALAGWATELAEAGQSCGFTLAADETMSALPLCVPCSAWQHVAYNSQKLSTLASRWLAALALPPAWVFVEDLTAPYTEARKLPRSAYGRASLFLQRLCSWAAGTGACIVAGLTVPAATIGQQAELLGLCTHFDLAAVDGGLQATHTVSGDCYTLAGA